MGYHFLVKDLASTQFQLQVGLCEKWGYGSFLLLFVAYCVILIFTKKVKYNYAFGVFDLNLSSCQDVKKREQL